MPAKKAVIEAVPSSESSNVPSSESSKKKERKPRKKKEADSAPKKLSAYNIFVKEHYHKVSEANPSEKPASILKRVSVMWNEHKAKATPEPSAK